jgi:hypothetical protein
MDNQAVNAGFGVNGAVPTLSGCTRVERDVSTSGFVEPI